MPDPDLDPRPFLTIVAWPEGAGRDVLAQLLADTTGRDFATMRLRLGQDPPMVIEQVPPAFAARAVASLIDLGGDAFTFRLAELEALGPTMPIRDLRIVSGAIEMDLRGGVSTTITRESIQILVRAQITRTVTRREAPRFGSMSGLMSMRMRGMAARRAAIESAVTKDVETTEKLDIHTTDGSVYQIDGRRFGYRALGDLRGYSDKTNMDKMCELLSHLAPDEVVDTYFGLWHAPVGYRRLAVPNRKANRDDPEFAFYSRWSALVYRHVLGVR